MFRYFFGILSAVFLGMPAYSGTIFLTGHDPDFHAINPSGNVAGARNINNAAINYILDPLFNDVVAGGVSKFLFVESNIAVPGGHRVGELGIQQSGFTPGVHYEKHDAATLSSELNLLGSKYAGIVVASDFGGLLTQSELDILNARSGDIISFLNNDNGGLYAMSQGNSGAGLTPGGGHFGFLPFVVSSTAFNAAETGVTVTAFGASLGLTNADVNGNFSHNIFTNISGTGLQVVDQYPSGNILTVAGRGQIDPGSGIIPLPGSVYLLLGGMAFLGGVSRSRRRRRIA